MEVKGSFTVEASLIFPVISFVLIAIIYIAIYSHEKVCLQSIANGAEDEVQSFLEDTLYDLRLERGLYEDLNYEGGIEEHIKTYVNNTVEKTLIITNKESLNIETNITPHMGYKKIDITISKDFLTPFSFIKDLMKGKDISIIKIEVHSSSKLYQPTNTIRMIDILDDLTNDIAATKELKKKYEEILIKIEESIKQWI
ncbi:MAG: hypothetical protein CVV02_07940 [Firmicutes bacterium HGW-Firmicutes-7]|nr:MAG: hypothetical protein CVV02_07940 [Firmicutes bacterium HGW-Firmicutes-7]